MQLTGVLLVAGSMSFISYVTYKEIKKKVYAKKQQNIIKSKYCTRR